MFEFDNSYARLPDRFHQRLAPTPVSAPRLIKLNGALALELGLDPGRLASAEGVAVLAGNAVADGSEPVAQAYAGHQFGGFVPQLGDGRAVLLGEIIDRQDRRRDIQLKGAGPTVFSRRGDGRAALGPVLREYIVSEAMAALGIATTRSLAVVATGDHVFREEALPGGVLTRVAASHLRVGTFQYFAARGDAEGVRLLADYAIDRHYPEARAASDVYKALLDGVIARQARLVAQWLGVGFIHGVMNTDNSSISGETIDYGPCAFMDDFHPGRVLSSIDTQGRYAYANQPQIAQWNMARLAETLLPLLVGANDEDKLEVAKASLSQFAGLFEAAYADVLGAKIGVAQAGPGDLELVHDLLKLMMDGGADFTLVFRRLSDAVADEGGLARVGELFSDAKGFLAWVPRWRERLARDGGGDTGARERMRRANPAFIPRNHLVEQAIEAAVRNDDFEPFETLNAVLAAPFEDQPGRDRFMQPPQPDEIVGQTFCGT
ncbi:MAG: protein adenylyltransferase SelO [Hyphomicrobiaceae bacterium]